MKPDFLRSFSSSPLSAVAAGLAIRASNKGARAPGCAGTRLARAAVRPIILPDGEFFLLLSHHEREVFKEEFWKRRERDGLAFPLGRGYRQRYEELLHAADTTYDGRREDAGRMVIAHGEPASIEPLEDCRNTFRDLEIWTYRRTSAGGSDILRYFFYRRSPSRRAGCGLLPARQQRFSAGILPEALLRPSPGLQPAGG
jgi:GWxTD domain-containing protein